MGGKERESNRIGGKEGGNKSMEGNKRMGVKKGESKRKGGKVGGRETSNTIVDR